MRISRSFTARLIRNILVITSVLFTISVAIITLFSDSLIADEARKRASSMLDATISDAQLVLSQVETATANTAWLIPQDKDNVERVLKVAEMIVSQNSDVFAVTFAANPDYPGMQNASCLLAYTDINNGKIQIENIPVAQQDYTIDDWFQIPLLLGKPCWCEPFYDQLSGSDMLLSAYSYPLVDGEGRVSGVISVAISLEWLTTRMQKNKPYPNAYSVLVGRSGKYIVHPDVSRIMNETIFTYAVGIGDPMSMRLGHKMLSGERGLEQLKVGNKLVFAAYAPMPNGWTAALMCPYRDVFAKNSQLNLIIALVALIGLFVILFSCTHSIRKVTEPITEFTVAAGTMAKANFHARIPEVNTQDELARLRESFLYMQKTINHYIDELRSTTKANERFESELNIARSIQLAMVPGTFPAHPDFTMHALLRPAKEVGGDLYDYVVMDDKLYFAVGDVSGKGVPAALFMAISRATFHFVAKMQLSMSEVVSRINDAVSDGNETGMFVTFYAGCLDLKTGHLEFCNGGHNPILFVAPDGKAAYYKAKANLAVGLFPDFPYQGESMDLAPGTRIVLYTDGVTEAENAAKDLYGEPRLKQWAESLPAGTPVQEAVPSLLSDIKAFTLDNEQNDDITIMIIDYKPNK